MGERRALRKDDNGVTVLREQRIPLESDLQEVLVEHPEALPAEDLGLGSLTSLGWELDLGTGPMDQLAVDLHGQLVIVEYKKGSENPDVRTVVAQLLDYGSALWRTSLEELEGACRENGTYSLFGEQVSVVDHVLAKNDDAIAPAEFTRALKACLESGTFVFLYVARDLDPRTRRVLTYLSEGAGLRFYAVEIDWFAAEDGGVLLVPRVAFVPATVAAGPSPGRAPDPSVDELTSRIDAVADEHRIDGFRSETGRRWGRSDKTVLGVYTTSSGVMFWLPEIADLCGDHVADNIRADLGTVFPERRLPAKYPAVEPADFLERWDRGASEVVAKLFSESATSHAGRG